MNRRVYFTISCLVVGLFLLGFALVGATPDARAASKEVKVEMLGTKVGTMSALLCHALADIVNKNHPTIRLNVTATMGTTDALRTFANLSPDKQRHMFAFSGDSDYLAARAGKPPFGKPCDDLRFVANMLRLVTCPMTLNEKIRTKADVAGTKWSAGPRGASISAQAEFLVWDIWGLKGKTDLKYLSWTAGKDAFVARLVDVYFAGGIPLGNPLGSKAKGNPAADELVTTQPVRFIELTKEDFDRGKAKREKAGDPVPWYYIPIKAGAYGKGKPSFDTGGIGLINGWFASKYTDEEVIYGLTKTLLQNFKAFQDYHKATSQMTLGGFSDAPFITEADVHPGALKAYKEFGVKIGP
jgi:TRAP transporter TAXI family solute receptor